MIYKILNRKLKNEKKNKNGEVNSGSRKDTQFLLYVVLLLYGVGTGGICYAYRPLTPFSTIFLLYLVLNLNRSTMGKPLTCPLVTDTLFITFPFVRH